jgi:hypothetical protein
VPAQTRAAAVISAGGNKNSWRLELTDIPPRGRAVKELRLEVAGERPVERKVTCVRFELQV